MTDTIPPPPAVPKTDPAPSADVLHAIEAAADGVHAALEGFKRLVTAALQTQASEMVAFRHETTRRLDDLNERVARLERQ